MKSCVFIEKAMIKSLGPAHYNPNDQLRKKKCKTPLW